MNNLAKFSIVSIALGLTFLPWIVKAIKRKRRQTQYHQIQHIVTQVYDGINPYVLFEQAKTEYPFFSSHYGEIETQTLLDLLILTRPTKNDIFYDLGAGIGKALLAAKLRYPFLQVKGLEWLPLLREIAQSILEQYEITCICADLIQYDFSEATILLVNATAFSGDMWEQLLAKLLCLKPATRIIITTKTLPASSFRQLFQGMEKMSWGLTSTFIYQKI